MSFNKLGLLSEFESYFQEKGFKTPTKVQTKVIPQLLEDKSLLVTAQTGTGKTLAYALPVCHQIKLLENAYGLSNKRARPLSIIVAPTKELAMQIQGVFKEISHHVKIRSRLVTGGMKNEQLAKLASQGFEVLVGTPNKIKTALQTKKISTSDLKYLVFDEADTLFEMGFKKDIQDLLKFVNREKVEISFFTATLPVQVELFINERFADKNLVKVTTADTHKVQQKIETFNLFVSPKEKLLMLSAFIDKTAKGRGIIFANQKNQVEEITQFLTEKFPKLKFKTLHGDMPAKDRLSVHKDFNDKKAQILVATDVAARGIDISDLLWVFNFGLPKNAEFYLHRCGRVGRMGRKGFVYNLVTDWDAKLVALINDAIKKQTSLNLDDIAANMSELRKPKKSVKKKVKTKRVKVTKRTKF